MIAESARSGSPSQLGHGTQGGRFVVTSSPTGQADDEQERAGPRPPSESAPARNRAARSALVTGGARKREREEKASAMPGTTVPAA